MDDCGRREIRKRRAQTKAASKNKQDSKRRIGVNEICSLLASKKKGKTKNRKVNTVAYKKTSETKGSQDDACKVSWG